MKRATTTHSKNNLLVNQVRNMHHSARQVQRTVENNREMGNVSKIKMRLPYSTKVHTENTDKPEKNKTLHKKYGSIRCKMGVDLH